MADADRSHRDAKAGSAPPSSRLGLAWVGVRDSLWFVPTIAAITGGALAVVAVGIPSPKPGSRFAWIWLFGGGAEGARGVLSAIAGGLITVTGVVFSVTIVALQLASSQFTPRLLRSFVADRVNQVVLGVFIGTFTYTLLVLRTIRSTPGGEPTFVPQVGVTIAVVLLLVSIGALIVFIDHAARSVQAGVILRREAEHTLERIRVLFPEPVGDPASAAPDTAPRCPTDPPAVVTAAESGYLQAVHADTLWEVADRRRLTIRMELRVGSFAFPGKPLASVWPADLADDAVTRAVREAFVLGEDRTPEQDAEFGIVELSDIAVRALSPGINDPTTAMRAIDRLTEVLAALGSRRAPDTLRKSDDGSALLVAQHTTFDRAVGLAFNQIRHFGAANPEIANKLIVAAQDLAGVVPLDRAPALEAHVDAVVRAARRAVEDPNDLARIEKLADETRALLARGER